MRANILILFVLVSMISSLLRFGQRENNIPNVESDSDYYLDMAQVFVGEKAEINKAFFKSNEHHYNRPLLPFCAGLLGHYMLNNNYAAAFSIINILAAIFIAFLFYIIIRRLYPTILYPWFPSVLFLTAFPQMDFGYHILTETIGLAFALGTCYFVYNLICSIEKKETENDMSYAYYKDWRVYFNVLLLFLIQVLSFLTRETALFVFIFLVYLTIKRKLYHWKYLPLVCFLYIVLIIAKLPHTLYAQLYGTHIPAIGIDIKTLTDPRYILDAIVKLGLAFNIAWLVILPAFYFLIKGKWISLHEFIIGWSLAALGYIAAGYLHNKMIPNGYPLRMFFSLFPLFYLLVISFLEKIFSPPRLNYIIGMFLILHVGISVFGVILDSGTVTVHNIFDLFKAI
jgi:hypothetical protein